MTLREDYTDGVDTIHDSDVNAWTAAINDAYVVPGGGIPAATLAAAVQTSLGKADSALQTIDSTTPTDITTTGAALWTATDAAAGRTALSALAAGDAIGTPASGDLTNCMNLPLAGLASAAYAAAATASTLAERDAAANLTAHAFIQGFTSTATAGATTTMDIASTPVQRWTGTTTQTIKLPTTGVVAGAMYEIINDGSSAANILTMQSSDGTTIVVLANATKATFIALVNTPTAGTHWYVKVWGFNVGSGKRLDIINTIALAGTDGKTYTFPTVDATMLYSGGALGTPSSGTLTSCGSLPISGLTASTSTAIGVGSVELGHATDCTIARVGAGVASIEGVTVDTISAANTLTNKRVTPRAGTAAGPGGTPTLATDSYDVYTYTALAAAITSMSTNLSGSPTIGQRLLLGFKDNGSPRTIAWGASFKSSGSAVLLATTVASKQHWVGLMYDGSAWVCVACDSVGY